MISSVIGMGEVGSALYEILKDVYPVQWFDKDSCPSFKTRIMHVCFPDSDGFCEEVARYAKIQEAEYIVIHSSVKVGTTKKVYDLTKVPSFHSPVRGKHPDLIGGIRAYKKYVSYNGEKEEADNIAKYFNLAGISTEVWENTDSTELAKLLELSRYGVYIAFAKEQSEICRKFGVDYSRVVNAYESSRTEGLKSLNCDDLIQPILYPFESYVGGHCTVEDMEILLNQNESPLLKTAYLIDRGTAVWGNCNIYPTAKIGKGCSIGHGCEIGNNVKIGNEVRIGAMCFIPEGVTIEDCAFIAPCVRFSNDKHPPSNKKEWGKILVQKKAVIGMGSTILPGVTIGEGAMIGAGAVVTKNVPKGETWYGVPAMPHGKP